MGREIPPPSRLRGLGSGERRELPSGVRGGAPAENDFRILEFSKHVWTPLVAMFAVA